MKRIFSSLFACLSTLVSVLSMLICLICVLYAIDNDCYFSLALPVLSRGFKVKRALGQLAQPMIESRLVNE